MDKNGFGSESVGIVHACSAVQAGDVEITVHAGRIHGLGGTDRVSGQPSLSGCHRLQVIGRHSRC